MSWYEALAYANLLSDRHDPPLARCYELTSCRGEIGRGDYVCGVQPTGRIYDDAGLPANIPKVYDCEGFRLPTDAEWEYAARAGARTALYSGGILERGEYLQNATSCYSDSNLERVGWYCWNSAGQAHPVNGLEPNGWGIHDMLGNLSEWINDRSDGLPPLSPTDPDGEVQPDVSRNLRGGSYGLWASACRLANQSEADKGYRSAAVGFRLARTLR